MHKPKMSRDCVFWEKQLKLIFMGEKFFADADLHMHTIHSRKDSISTPDVLAEKCRAVGLEYVAITNHDTTEGTEEVREAAKEIGYGLTVIKGEEITTGELNEDGKETEIQAYPLEETIPRGLSMRKTLEEIKKQGGFVAVPHQFELWRHGAGEEGGKQIIAYAKEMEIPLLWEIFNSRSTKENNKRAMKFYKEKRFRAGLLKVAGSDSHHPREIGRVKLSLPHFKTRDEFLKSLQLSSRWEINFHGDDTYKTTVFCRFLVRANHLLSKTPPFVQKLFKSLPAQ
ncbi:MAG: PHP domain-containing protein [Candidatus Levybacteria bacterium]|nr:PHP domain-containing protein [Candidatus Levybacteria bacterium]